MKTNLVGARHSVVCILGDTDSGRARTFLGTGLVVSPTVVLTCAHVLQELIELHPDQGEQLAWPFVLRGGKIYRAKGCKMSSRLDLCLLHFSQLPHTKPALPIRVGSLKNCKLSALGFDAGNRVRLTEVHDLSVIQEGISRKRNQWAQIDGGLPAGFSGAPILAGVASGWKVVGIAKAGGDAATSRMIGADAMAAFLNNQNIRIPSTVFALETKASPGSPLSNTKIMLRVGRSIKDSVVDLSGAEASAHVGDSIGKSIVRIRNQAHRR